MLLDLLLDEELAVGGGGGGGGLKQVWWHSQNGTAYPEFQFGRKKGPLSAFVTPTTPCADWFWNQTNYDARQPQKFAPEAQVQI